MAPSTMTVPFYAVRVFEALRCCRFLIGCIVRSTGEGEGGGSPFHFGTHLLCSQDFHWVSKGLCRSWLPSNVFLAEPTLFASWHVRGSISSRYSTEMVTRFSETHFVSFWHWRIFQCVDTPSLIGRHPLRYRICLAGTHFIYYSTYVTSAPKILHFDFGTHFAKQC